MISDIGLDQIVNEVREITAADVLVLLLPCDCDAHFELGLAYGLGIDTVVVGQPADGKWVGMHMLVTIVLDDDSDVAGCLALMRQKRG
jgi:hypothetical protein